MFTDNGDYFLMRNSQIDRSKGAQSVLLELEEKLPDIKYT
jgi:hypothetical protein